MPNDAELKNNSALPGFYALNFVACECYLGLSVYIPRSFVRRSKPEILAAKES